MVGWNGGLMLDALLITRMQEEMTVTLHATEES